VQRAGAVVRTESDDYRHGKECSIAQIIVPVRDISANVWMRDDFWPEKFRNVDKGIRIYEDSGVFMGGKNYRRMFKGGLRTAGSRHIAA
jgi:hypothetical protein